jgi:hypothetical protein
MGHVFVAPIANNNPKQVMGSIWNFGKSSQFQKMNINLAQAKKWR